MSMLESVYLDLEKGKSMSEIFNSEMVCLGLQDQPLEGLERI